MHILFVIYLVGFMQISNVSRALSSSLSAIHTPLLCYTQPYRTLTACIFCFSLKFFNSIHATTLTFSENYKHWSNYARVSCGRYIKSSRFYMRATIWQFVSTAIITVLEGLSKFSIWMCKKRFLRPRKAFSVATFSGGRCLAITIHFDRTVARNRWPRLTNRINEVHPFIIMIFFRCLSSDTAEIKSHPPLPITGWTANELTQHSNDFVFDEHTS